MRLIFSLLSVFINILIIGLFLYSKLLPYKDRLMGNYKKAFDFFDSLYNPIFKWLKQRVKPHQVGSGLFIDMSQFIVLLILLFLITLLH
jgi:uncharacterized protein YggT (Ycf19 family)